MKTAEHLFLRGFFRPIGTLQNGLNYPVVTFRNFSTFRMHLAFQTVFPHLISSKIQHLILPSQNRNQIILHMPFYCESGHLGSYSESSCLPASLGQVGCPLNDKDSNALLFEIIRLFIFHFVNPSEVKHFQD